MPFAEGVPTGKVTLGGMTYELAWTWGAKRRVRDALLERGKDAATTNVEERFALALWAAMDKESRESITVEEIEDLIHPGNEQEIADRLNALTEKSEPEGESEPKTEPGAVTTPTPGSRSNSAGQLAATI